MPNFNNNDNKIEKETIPYEIIIINNLIDNYFIQLMKEINIQKALKDNIYNYIINFINNIIYIIFLFYIYYKIFNNNILIFFEYLLICIYYYKQKQK